MPFQGVHARGGAYPGRPGRPRQIDVVDVCATSVLGVVLVLLIAVLVGPLIGYRALLIRSGSMTPTFGVGDLVIDTSVPPLGVRLGEVVSFKDPALDNQLVTHRVIAMHQDGNRVDFVTEGDANSVSEHWSVPVNGSLGRAVLSDPAIGRLIVILIAPLARVIEVVLGAILLGYIGVSRIWRQAAPFPTGSRQRSALRELSVGPP